MFLFVLSYGSTVGEGTGRAHIHMDGLTPCTPFESINCTRSGRKWTNILFPVIGLEPKCYALNHVDNASDATSRINYETVWAQWA